ncbi:MAG: hypothetical protein GTO03_13755 [Planctomycetales bacterium]|nr:hypothetical protein [Planctomycetales bacterium]
MVPQLSESQLTELAAALSEVPRLLGQRKLAEAKQSLQRAQALERQGAEGPHSARVRRMELLCDYVEQFWDAVRQGMPGVEGEDLHFGEMVIHVSVANERGIRYRDRGRNVTWRFYEMPAQLARAIAEKWLDDRPTSQIFLGAFMAVDPKYGVEKARQRWQRARQGGAPVDELMPILDEL